MSSGTAPRVIRILIASAIGAVALRFALLTVSDFDMFDFSSPTRRLLAGVAGAVVLVSLSQVFFDPVLALEAGGATRSRESVQELRDKLRSNEMELRS